MMKIEGSGSESGSGSISQRHGSADPDPHQNVMDPEHCATDTSYYEALNQASITAKKNHMNCKPTRKNYTMH